MRPAPAKTSILNLCSTRAEMRDRTSVAKLLIVLLVVEWKLNYQRQENYWSALSIVGCREGMRGEPLLNVCKLVNYSTKCFFDVFSSKLKWGLKDFCRIKMLAASGVSCKASVKWWCRYLFAQAKLSEQNSSKRELFYFYNFCWAQATVVHFCELLPRKCIP